MNLLKDQTKTAFAMVTLRQPRHKRANLGCLAYWLFASAEGEQEINIVLSQNIKKIAGNAVVPLVAVVALLLSPGITNRLVAVKQARLVELTGNAGIAENMLTETSRVQQESEEIKQQINRYDTTPVDKDLILSELARLSSAYRVEVTQFSEVINPPPVTLESDAEAEALEDQSPGDTSGIRVEATSFTVTLKGGNEALYETLKSVKRLNGTNRITAVSWISDYVAAAQSRVQDNTTLLESLSRADFLETYKLLEMAFTETSSLSFTIEYLYWTDESVNSA